MSGQLKKEKSIPVWIESILAWIESIFARIKSIVITRKVFFTVTAVVAVPALLLVFFLVFSPFFSGAYTISSMYFLALSLCFISSIAYFLGCRTGENPKNANESNVTPLCGKAWVLMACSVIGTFAGFLFYPLVGNGFNSDFGVKYGALCFLFIAEIAFSAFYLLLNSRLLKSDGHYSEFKDKIFKSHVYMNISISIVFFISFAVCLWWFGNASPRIWDGPQWLKWGALLVDWVLAIYESSFVKLVLTGSVTTLFGGFISLLVLTQMIDLMMFWKEVKAKMQEDALLDKARKTLAELMEPYVVSVNKYMASFLQFDASGDTTETIKEVRKAAAEVRKGIGNWERTCNGEWTASFKAGVETLADELESIDHQLANEETSCMLPVDLLILQSDTAGKLMGKHWNHLCREAAAPCKSGSVDGRIWVTDWGQASTDCVASKNDGARHRVPAPTRIELALEVEVQNGTDVPSEVDDSAGASPESGGKKTITDWLCNVCEKIKRKTRDRK